MSSDTEKRRLAAIMFTDMVGYSALSQRNPRLALELLEEHRQVLRTILPRFHGTEIKTIGDAFLVEFSSALEAAQCAIEIQRALAHRNHDVPPERRVEIKIGIHIGDVVHRGGDVYGDGVNIASRIEPLAGPGGICVSMDVERQIRNSVETRFEKLARTELKNISIHMELFRMVLPWEKQLARPTTKFAISRARSRSWTWATAAVAVLLVVGGGWWWWATRRSSATRDKTRSEVAQQSENIPAKSIAVLPFENLSEEKQTEYFADGVQDEIMTRLASIGDLKVISRTSTAKYKSKPEDLKTLSQQLGVATVLEGSVQRAEGKVRVNVQLLDARADTHLWADTYDRPLTDIFAVESDIATRIANALQAKLTGNERAKIAERPTQNTEAHDLYFKAHMLEAKSTHEDALKAIEYYKQAIALDPNYAVAYAELSQALTYDTGYSRMPAAELLVQARVAAEKALALDPNLPEAHVSLGAIALSEMNIKEAKSEFERAIALNSNLSGAHYYLSMLLAAEGQFDASIVEAKRAIQLDPLSLIVRERLGNTYRYARRYPEAKKIFETVIQLNPAYAQAQDSLGICLELTGDLDGAVAQFKKSFQLDHDFHSVVFLAHCYAIKGEREKATQTLAQAQELEKKAGAEWAYGYALVYMGLGDQEQAVDWLERSYEAKESFALLLIIKVDPLLDPLRGNPRFEALVNKIIPPAAI